MYCSKCGKEIDKNTKFCPYCGEKYGNQKTGKKQSNIILVAAAILVLVISLFLVIGGKKDNLKAENSLQENTEDSVKTSVSTLPLNDVYEPTADETEVFQMRSLELEKESDEYRDLNTEPMYYKGTLYQGYRVDDETRIYDEYYLWLDEETEIEYTADYNDEVKTRKVKGFLVQCDNLDPMCGEEVICYGKMKESPYGAVELSMVAAVVLSQDEVLQECTYKDTPNKVNAESKEVNLQDIFQKYKNLLVTNLANTRTIAFQTFLENYFGFAKRNVSLYGTYMLEDLNNDDIPEIIFQGELDYVQTLFIVDHQLKYSTLPGEMLYIIPGKNLFYTAEGYDDFIFYACWYRGENRAVRDSNMEDVFTYMKAFEGGMDANGNYSGYDYTNVLLGQNTMREQSYSILEKVDEVTPYLVRDCYSYSDTSPMDNWSY